MLFPARPLARILALITPVGIAAAASAATLDVPGAFPTINDAVAASTDGDVIRIAPGAYNETMILSNRDLTFRSTTGDPDDVFIKAINNNVFRILGSSEVTLDGLTISATGGSAVLVTGDAFIEDCIFVDCEIETFGAAIQVPLSSGFVDVRRTDFIDNSAGSFGAAVYISGGGSGVARDCYFQGNETPLGIAYVFNGFLTLERCRLQENITETGLIGTNGTGNMLVQDSVLFKNQCGVPVLSNGTTKITNVTIEENLSTVAGLGRGAGNLVVTNCIARDPSGLPPFDGLASLTAEYSNIQDGPGGPGMIDADPIYIDGTLMLDAGSPGIDAASGSAASSFDINGYARAIDEPNIPNSGTGAIPFVDMGAMERISRIRYVDAQAGPGTGASWASPYNDLQDALDEALADPASVDEIWLANGVYRPDRGTSNRSLAFRMQNNLDIIGGYAGGETRRDQTNFPVNQTILTGELNGSSLTDNAYNVVEAVNVGNALLRGVIIERGHANGPETYDRRGAGLLVRGGGPAFDQVWIRQCDASGDGHAARIEDSTATFTRFRVNRNGVLGNLSARGAISVSDGNTSFSQVLAHGNASAVGACFDFVDGATSNVHLATIAGNTSSIWVAGIGAFGSNVTMTNSVVAENIALNPFPDQPAWQENWFNTSLQWTTVSGLEPGLFGTNGFDPKFVDPDGADNVPGTADDNYRLSAGSCLIDSGNNTFVPSGTSVDLVGVTRRLNDAGSPDSGVGPGAIVDRGAYEFDGTSCRADLDGDGSIGFSDLLNLLAAWGICNDCPADIDCDGEVAFGDLLALLAAFGPCP
ncbi:MAG: right-handed parallel beta-helix repeat-containing protein [Phycisphaerales bacterium]